MSESGVPPLLRILLPVITLAGLAALALAFLHSLAPDREARLKPARAQHIASPKLASVREDAWQKFASWRRFRHLAGASGEYGAFRVSFELDAVPAEPLGLFIPTYDSSLAAYVNGRYVGEAGSVTPPIASNGYHPALFRMRPEDLRTGRNDVTLIVAQTIPGIGIVHGAYLDSYRALERAARWIEFASVDILRIYNGLFVVLGAFALFVYAQLRRESVFLWFVALIAFCGLRNLDLVMPRWPESDELRAMLVFGSSLGILLSCVGFVNRLVDRRYRFDRWLLLAMPPMLAGYWWRMNVDLLTAIDAGYAVLRIVFACVAPLMIWRLATVARRLPSWRSGWMLGCLCMACVFVAHDVVTMWTSDALDYQYSLLASLPMLSAFVVAVGHRYVESAHELERSHATLAQRVRETEAELAVSYEQLRTLERDRALAAERQRIMRDVHDGVGGQLTGLVMKLRRSGAGGSEIADLVEASLHDLRLIIDSLDECVTGDVRTALGTFRHRVEPWLKQHGIGLDWRADVGDGRGFGPRETLQLFRILQEACSNVVRHAQARRIAVEIRGDDGALRLSVSDDGRGFVADGVNAGRGLANMRRRARELGGDAVVSSDANGTTVQVTVPRAAAEAVTALASG